MTEEDQEAATQEEALMLNLWVKTQNLFVADDEGASLVEYALLLVLIAVVAIVVVTQVGQSTSETFSTVNDSMNDVNN